MLQMLNELINMTRHLQELCEILSTPNYCRILMYDSELLYK